MISDRIIYDMHTHIFPDKLAARAVGNIGGYYGIEMQCDGTALSLVTSSEELPNLRYVVSSASLKAETMRVGNDFLLSMAEKDKRLIPFSSFYPGVSVAEAEAELIRVKALGSKGIKLHPDFQHFNIDDSHATEIYRVCEALDLPILFHVGDRTTDYSTPERVYNVANAIPGLKIIAAHLCGYSVWDEAERVLIGTGVYTEVSDALMCLPRERVVSLIRKHGIDKVMFGSDYPLKSPADVFAEFDTLPFNEDEKERIYRTNAEKLLGIRG